MTFYCKFFSLLQFPDEDDYIDKGDLSVAKFHDNSCVALIIEVIGLMCDGQHREMQNYLREQKSSITNVNIVEEITSFLYEYSKRRLLTVDILPLITEAFQALIELCSGNLENSEVIFQKQILSIINYYLQLDITNIKGSHEKKMEYIKLRISALKLKATVVELLDAMLEKISGDTEKLTQQILEGLDIHALHYSMVDFLILKDDEDLIEQKADDNASRALFKTYSVINQLASSETSTGSKIGECLQESQKSCSVKILLFGFVVPISSDVGAYEAWKFCKINENTRTIEVVYKGDDDEEILTKVHFNVNLKVRIPASIT